MSDPRPAPEGAALYESLTRSQAALTRAGDVAPATVEAILAERARLLAAEPPRADPAATLEVLEFGRGAARYGLESRFIREVYPLKGLTALPGVPPFVCGILNIRGQIRSVVDLQVLFALAPGPVPLRQEVILLQAGAMEFGLLADTIHGVHQLSWAAIHPPPLTLSGVQQDLVAGLTAAGLVVLDAARLLADPRLIVHDSL